jgi:hypothetical protein
LLDDEGMAIEFFFTDDNPGAILPDAVSTDGCFFVAAFRSEFWRSCWIFDGVLISKIELFRAKADILMIRLMMNSTDDRILLLLLPLLPLLGTVN